MLKNVDRYLAIERSIRTSELAGIAKSILALVNELNDRLSDEAYGSLFDENEQRALSSIRKTLDRIIMDAFALNEGLGMLSCAFAHSLVEDNKLGDCRHEKKDCH